MPRSYLKYIAAAVIVVVLATVAYTLTSRSPGRANLSPTQGVEVAGTQLDEFFAQATQKPLIDHLTQLLTNNDWQAIGAELSVLRHGKDTGTPALEHLSASTQSTNGVVQYPHAVRLGKWLGSIRIALAGSSNNTTENFNTLLAQLNLATHTATAGINYQNDFSDVLKDVSAKNLTLSSAIELISYVEINNADISGQISDAIENVIKNN